MLEQAIERARLTDGEIQALERMWVPGGIMVAAADAATSKATRVLLWGVVEWLNEIGKTKGSLPKGDGLAVYRQKVMLLESRAKAKALSRKLRKHIQSLNIERPEGV